MADYDADDMVRALGRAGLRRGDTVLFHTSLGLLGLPRGVVDQESLNRLFLECARRVLGPEGTMLVPVYTYSLCRGETFDLGASPAAIGPFPEFFRRHPGVVRSAEPILSVCGLGPLARELFADLPPTCYGEDCLYARLVARRALICTVGLGLNWATFLHHIEEMAEVPYRYRKIFRGDMIDASGQAREVAWTYNVRLWSKNADVDAGELVAAVVADGLCAREPLGRGGLCCVRANDYFAYATDRIRRDPWIAARGPAGDPLAMEAARVPPLSFALDLSPRASLEETARALTPLPRDGLGDAADAALDALATLLPVQASSWRTGELHGGSVVPEKWTCREASLATLSGRTVFSLADSPLHVMQRSHAFSGEMSRQELLAHLHTHPDDPEAIPFVANPSRRQWGLCCSGRQKERLGEERYRVSLRADFSLGRLRVGEVAAPGAASEAELVLCGWLGRSGRFDDGLSGVLAGVEVLRARLAGGPRRLGCRLVIFPGIAGWRAWLEQAGPHPGRATVLLNRLAGPAPLALAATDATGPLAAAFRGALLGNGVLPAPSREAPGADGETQVAGLSVFRTGLGQDDPFRADPPEAAGLGRVGQAVATLLAAIADTERRLWP
jgi:aminoglycoside N3'-acetyltransferase